MIKKLNRTTANFTSTRPVKVLQFGEGNFLRAFVDWIVNTLNEKTDFNSDVVVVQPISAGMGEMINQQDGLYHVILNGIKNGKATTETKLITCLREVINPYQDFQAYLKTGENPDLKFIVSNTTEAGISFNVYDTNPQVLPDSFPGKLTVLLYHRFNHFQGAADKALTIIPCELIDKNGQNLRDTILQFIKHWNLPDDFREWIVKHTTFCNTLVDRIVPGFPRENINDIQQQIGYEDNLVVTAEPFHLWVIEGPADLQRIFPTDKAGLDVIFVDDQSPYRTRKVRILNGAHTALVPVAYLHGLRTVRESVEDSFAGEFIKKALFDEIIPTLDLPPKELEQFAADVMERFRNPFIKHELSAIALNSISKYKVRVLPSVLEYHQRKGGLPNHLVFSLACLIRFYQGSWKGESLPVNDTPDIITAMQDAWSNETASGVAKAVLSNVAFWNTDLTTIPGLEKKVTTFLERLIQDSNVPAALG